MKNIDWFAILFVAEDKSLRDTDLIRSLNDRKIVDTALFYSAIRPQVNSLITVENFVHLETATLTPPPLNPSVRYNDGSVKESPELALEIRHAQKRIFRYMREELAKQGHEVPDNFSAYVWIDQQPSIIDDLKKKR